jgi:microcystin-dependent protein
MDEMLGSIQFFAGNFAPRNFAFCDGALLQISSNTALFSLLGTTYGGDGRTTFALPDLRGRAALGPRRGPGLSSYNLGQRGGQEEHTLLITEMPSHNHTTTNNTAADQHVLFSTDTAVRDIPEAGDVPAAAVTAPGLGAGIPVNSFGPANTTINGQTLSGNAGLTINNNGGQQSHNNIQPYLAVNYIIALQGYFPSRS